MTGKKIAASAEEMKLKLFGRQQNNTQITQVQPGDTFAVYQQHVGKIVTIPMKHITVEDNVRKTVDRSSHKFQKLCKSIKRNGLLENLVVELRKNQSGSTYISLVAGQRRYFAAEVVGLERVPCLLKEYSQEDRVSTGLSENLLREDLNCVDVADAYAELRRCGDTEEEIADRFERSERTVHRYLIIAAWPDDVKKMMRDHPDIFPTRVIFNLFVSKKFKSEEELRNAVKDKLSQGSQSGKQKVTLGKEVKAAASNLASRLQLPVTIKGTEQVGKITISYNNRGDLDKIIQIIQESDLV
jgi:ParB family transcriptional regulator, chromosome partitioning protein